MSRFKSLLLSASLLAGLLGFTGVAFAEARTPISAPACEHHRRLTRASRW